MDQLQYRENFKIEIVKFITAALKSILKSVKLQYLVAHSLKNVENLTLKLKKGKQNRLYKICKIHRPIYFSHFTTFRCHTSQFYKLQ